MLFKNKLLFFLKHILQMALKSNARFILSLLGFVIGIFIFTLSNIMLSSYYNSLFDHINEMHPKSIVVEVSNDDQDLLDKIENMKNEKMVRVSIADESSLIQYRPITEDIYHSTSARVIGVSSLENVGLTHINNQYQLAATIELLKGRLLTKNDYALQNEVVVIDKFTEQLLFPNINSIGQEVQLNTEIPGVANVSVRGTNEVQESLNLTVVGVIDNLYNTKVEQLNYEKGVLNLREPIFTNLQFYSPLSTVEEKLETSENKFFMWTFTDQIEFNELNEILISYQQISQGKTTEFNITTHSNLLKNEVQFIKPIETFINIILSLFLVISGISVMSIMFFSVKERIPEIGIKKAYGASKIDILIQFILEGMIISFVGAVIAIFLSVVISVLIERYIQNYLFILIEIHFSLDLILTPLFIAGIFGFVFCIIPSYYGSKIPVTSAIRFD